MGVRKASPEFTKQTASSDLNPARADKLHATWRDMQNRISTLEAKFNAFVAANTPDATAFVHEVPDGSRLPNELWGPVLTLQDCILVLNELKAQYNSHRQDARAAGTGAHVNADATNIVASPDASDQATAETLANEIKADYNAHRTQATVHANDDTANDVSAADASDLATLLVLTEELRAKFNAHTGDASGIDPSAGIRIARFV